MVLIVDTVLVPVVVVVGNGVDEGVTVVVVFVGVPG